jgi:outer membrane protein TolC
MQQQLLAGFGLGPNLRFLRIAKTNQKVSDIAFRAQVIATVTQICNLYWDLVSAYDEEQVDERSVEFASQTLDISRKQLELQAIPEMEVLKAEGEVANRQQDLTVSRTNLELQELYMKNAITRSLDDPVLQEMPVIPVDHIGTQIQPSSRSVQDMIADALKNRTELQESTLVLQNSELSRKTARNALLPTLSVYGFYAGTGYGGTTSASSGSTVPTVYLEERKKQIRIEVRNASYALEQGASRVEAAQKARDLAQKTLDIMQKEQKFGVGSNQQTLSAEHDLSLADLALVTAETAYEKSRIEVRRATGSILEDYGISITDARSGVVEGDNSN